MLPLAGTLACCAAAIAARTARRCPDRVAVQFGDVALTYAELDRAVDELAAELAGRGLEQGDRMLLLAGNSDSPTCSRGNLSLSNRSTPTPCRANMVADVLPAGPPPMTTTSHECSAVVI